jgi:DivIVA domain-containing protein
MTIDEYGSGQPERRISPADVENVQFSRAPMMKPGYNESEVERFKHRLADELARLHSEKAQLRDEVFALRGQVEQAAAIPPPSEQAVRILATAQQTADSYVAEAEDFSRQMTTDARAQYEEQLRRARESAGAIIQAAHEAAARMVGGTGGRPSAEAAENPTTEVLEEQVAYLKAFAQACRTQLRAYLEALLTDVESEWGKADPGSLPAAPLRTAAQRSDRPGAPPPPPMNVAREVPLSDSTSEHPAVGGDNGVEVLRARG